jgi:quinoprotein glucose dehydrogenase
MATPGGRRSSRRWQVLSWLAVLAGMVLLAIYQPWPKPPIGPITPAKDADGQWPVFGHSEGGARFSPLTQINRDNVQALEEAWRYSSGELAQLGADKARLVSSFQTTPILVSGALIGCTHRHVVFALDPQTGRERWRFDPQLKPSARGEGMLKCRGVAAFTDPMLAPDALCRTRVLLGASLSVIALDAPTGQPCPGFGTNGRVEVAIPGLSAHDEVQLRSPPAIVGDVAVFGSSLFDIYRTNSPSGMVRAFDVRTGALRWTWDPVPREPADPARASWGKGSANYVGAGNVWSFLSGDTQNGLVFLGTTSPAADFYGAHRPGDNRWANALVALKAETGAFVWGFQVTRHDLWDSDLPAMPILVELNRNGETIPAVVQLTKQGFVFVLNRLTGEPIHPVVDKPVPTRTDIPSEWVAPTQPAPTVIPPLTKQGLTPDEAWGFTPFDRAACRELIESYRSEGLYTPPSQQGTILMPAGAGGMNWGGGTIDAARGLLVVPTLEMPARIKLVPRDGAVDPRRPGAGAEEQLFPMKGTPFRADLQFVVSPLGAPCSAPPWATLTAVDLLTGKVYWRKPLGTTANLSRVPIALPLGAPFSGGPMMTAGGLVFMAGTTDRKLRAFDVSTGKVLWQTELPAGGMAVPMTYAVDGVQYVVIAAGGNNLFPGPMGDSVVAFKLNAGWRW